MSKDYISFFYKESQRFNSDNLRVTDVRNSLDRSSFDLPPPISMYQIAASRFIKFIVGAKLLLNFRSVGKFFFNVFSGLFKLKTERLQVAVNAIFKNPYSGSVVDGEGSLGKFLKDNSIDVAVTDTFQEATNSLNGIRGSSSGMFKTAYKNKNLSIVVFAEDQEEEFKDPDKFKKHFDVGAAADSGLNKNQQYFCVPEFVISWCDYALKFSEKVPSENLNEDKSTEFVKKVQATKAIAQKALEESQKTYNAILEADEKLSKEKLSKESSFFEKYINKQGITINKIDNLRMADESSKNYYKHALKDVTGDPLMKEFYSGMADFYSDKKAMNDSRKRKDLFDFFLDESDITSSSHSESVMVSKSLGEGGLVENGHQSKKKHVDVARSNPSGNFKNK